MRLFMVTFPHCCMGSNLFYELKRKATIESGDKQKVINVTQVPLMHRLWRSERMKCKLGIAEVKILMF